MTKNEVILWRTTSMMIDVVITWQKYYGAMARGCSIACSFCGFRPAKRLVVQNLIEVEIDGSTDSVVVCFLGKEEQAREGMSFLGRREYSDLTIPTVI